MSPNGTKYTKNMYKLCIAGGFQPHLSPIQLLARTLNRSGVFLRSSWCVASDNYRYSPP